MNEILNRNSIVFDSLCSEYDVSVCIITYNKESKNNIIQNMKQYNINFDHILKSNININIIYTEKGSQSLEFKKMISNLYNSSM